MQQGRSAVGKSGWGAPREPLVILLAFSGAARQLELLVSQGATKEKKARSRLAMAMLRGKVEANPQW